MNKKQASKRKRGRLLAAPFCSAIVVNLKLTGNKSNCRKVERNILEAVRLAVEEAASSNFTGEGKVEVEWTGTLQ